MTSLELEWAMRWLLIVGLIVSTTLVRAEFGKCHLVLMQATKKKAEGDVQARLKTHLAFLQSLWEDGRALAIGPFDDGGPLRGMQILKTDDQALAMTWASGDPMVREGYLRPIVLGWWTELTAFTHKGAFLDLQPFTFSLLYAPADRPKNSDEREKRQTDHIANITKMHDEGHLVLAGPFDEAYRYRGMFVFRGTDRAAIERMTQPDPLLGGGYLKMVHYTWYTSQGNFPYPK